MKPMTYAALALLVGVRTASAGIGPGEVDRLNKAAAALRESRTSIPEDYWNRARCIAVVPDLKKAAFIVGGEYGKGVMSCRAGDGWSAPVFLQLAKGSWGFQAGAEEVDVLMLVMNESGVQKMLKNNVTLGADASIAAGPVGRQANASTDASLTAEVLAYSRAKGLFAGLNLSGGVLRPDADSNRDAYGSSATPSTILASRGISAPTEASNFLQALELPGSVVAAVAAAPATSAPSPARSGNVPATTDSDLRTAIVAMQQTLDTMLADRRADAVGTSGQVGGDSATVGVSRERLEQLRSQLDALLAALNARGQ